MDDQVPQQEHVNRTSQMLMTARQIEKFLLLNLEILMLLKTMENNLVADVFSAIHHPKWFQNHFQLLHSTD